MRQGFDWGTIVGIVLLAGMMVGIAATSYFNTRALRDGAARADHSQEVIDVIGTVRADVRKLQAGQRGYIISGIESWLQPYDEAAAALRVNSDRLKTLAASDPEQQRRADAAGREIETGTAALNEVVALRREKGYEAIRDMSRTRGIRSFVDPLLETLAEMDRYERARLKEREEETRRAYDNAVFYGVAAAILGLVALGMFVWLLARSTRARTRAAARLEDQRELLNATLTSIGDAVIATDAGGNVTFLNAVAEVLTGWSSTEAQGVPLHRVFHIVNESTREPVDNPAHRALKEGVIVGLANHTILVARDGTERPIDDSAAPIRTRDAISGAVLVFRDISDRKRAEAEQERLLREVEAERARLAEVFRHAPSFMGVLLGPDYIFERTNDRYLELMGGRNVVGRPVREALPEVEGQGYFEILDRVFRTGEPYIGTNQRVVLDRGAGREERILDFVYQPLRDARGAVSGIIVQGIDLTERRRAEMDLVRVTAESERQRRMFETALSNTPDFTYLFDLEGRFTYVNKALLELWQKDLVAATGKSFYELDYPPDLAARLQSQIAEVIRTRQPLRDETPYTSASGTRAYEYIFVPVFGTDGEVEAVAGSTRDITDRKRSEASLMESEERYRVLVTATSDVVYRMRADWSEMLPIDGRDLVASNSDPIRDWMEMNLPQFEHDRVRDAINRAIALKHTFELEHRVIRADGTLGWTLSRAAPILDGAGNIVEWFGTARDVTERKQMEEALREADRKKDDFIALLAHELRNPLAPIRNGLQVIRLSEDRATRDRSQRMMDRQLAHMVRMIDDLLDVSRIGRHKMELRRERVALSDVLGSAVETSRPVIEEAGHELSVALPPLPVFLHADLTRLSQVFSNLLSNSAKYTERGGRVWLATELTDGAVVVTVRDTGTGIPAHALPTIFDMFSQVDRPIERNTGGLGIGLALVKGLVEMHGGTVSAHSEGQGRGSTFTVTLPALPGEPEHAPVSTMDSDLTAGHKRRVLVVDDNRDGAESLAMMLELIGNEVALAHDGFEAVERAEQFRPEIILMDVGMPRMNGLDATRRIREQSWGRTITIFALTGWGQDADRERSRQAGCDGHLVKPVNLADLEKLLATARKRS